MKPILSFVSYSRQRTIYPDALEHSRLYHSCISQVPTRPSVPQRAHAYPHPIHTTTFTSSTPTNPLNQTALERTYLAHMRTSLAFSLLGVLIAQLFSLQHSHFHDTSFGFYKVGVPLGCACQGCAILVGFFGACRFIRQQKAISRGKIHAGGWEVMVLAGLTVGVSSLCLFALHGS